MVLSRWRIAAIMKFQQAPLRETQPTQSTETVIQARTSHQWRRRYDHVWRVRVSREQNFWPERRGSTMGDDELRARGRSMEDAFFVRENERLRLNLREMGHQDASRGLAVASGIHNPHALEGLMASHVDGDTAAAMALVPLVAIAWTDRELHDQERAALLQAVEAAGILEGSPSHALLESWFRERPDPELFERWKSFIASLCVDMDASAVEALRAEIIGKARGVAEAAGGILGFGKVSAREQEILDELEHAFPM